MRGRSTHKHWLHRFPKEAGALPRGFACCARARKRRALYSAARVPCEQPAGAPLKAAAQVRGADGQDRLLELRLRPGARAGDRARRPVWGAGGGGGDWDGRGGVREGRRG